MIRVRTRLWLLVLALATAGVAQAGLDERAAMPGPTHHRRSADRLDQNDACETCHPTIASEWRRSLHRESFTDPMFQVAFARERESSFCQGCHAPEADPATAPDPRRAAIGVGCVSCHVVGQDILAAPGGAAGELAPHALRRDPGFAGPQACAGCHEFWSPSRGRGGHELKMQGTVGEHASSPARGRGCADCHMPPSAEGGRLHRSHDFSVASSPQMLEAAANIDAVRRPGAIELRLEPRAVGHAFPTGDLFRRLAVEIIGEGCGQTRYLGRHFGVERRASGADVKIELSDDRVGLGADARTVRLELPAACEDRPLRWSVRYQRVLDAPIGAEQLADVWDETTIAAGTLAPIKETP